MTRSAKQSTMCNTESRCRTQSPMCVAARTEAATGAIAGFHPEGTTRMSSGATIREGESILWRRLAADKHGRVRAVLFFVVTALLGCTPPYVCEITGEVSLECLCELYGRAACHSQQQCKIPYRQWRYTEMEQCQRATYCPYGVELGREVELGWLSYDPVAAANCFEQWLAEPCGRFIEDASRPTLANDFLGHCPGVTTGHQRIGDPCQSDYDCAEGYCGSTECAEGYCSASCVNAVCTPWLTEGEPCRGGDYSSLCAAGLVCRPHYAYSADRYCKRPFLDGDPCRYEDQSLEYCNADGLWCVSGTSSTVDIQWGELGVCRLRTLEVGDPCVSYNSGCREGLVCVDGTCAVRGGESAPCNIAAHCEAGLRCVVDNLISMLGTCQRLPGLGEPCLSRYSYWDSGFVVDIEGDCQPGLWCKPLSTISFDSATPGVCTERDVEGASCIHGAGPSPAQDSCAPGLVCTGGSDPISGGTCRPASFIGDPCGVGCIGSVCIDGVCRELAPLGASCMDSSECLSFYCEEGSCAQRSTCL